MSAKVKIAAPKTLWPGLALITFNGIKPEENANIGQFDIGNGITATIEWPDQIVPGESFHRDLEKIEGRPISISELGRLSR